MKITSYKKYYLKNHAFLFFWALVLNAFMPVVSYCLAPDTRQTEESCQKEHARTESLHAKDIADILEAHESFVFLDARSKEIIDQALTSIQEQARSDERACDCECDRDQEFIASCMRIKDRIDDGYSTIALKDFNVIMQDGSEQVRDVSPDFDQFELRAVRVAQSDCDNDTLVFSCEPIVPARSLSISGDACDKASRELSLDPESLDKVSCGSLYVLKDISLDQTAVNLCDIDKHDKDLCRKLEASREVREIIDGASRAEAVIGDRTGTQNVQLGTFALFNSEETNYNTGIGNYALYQNTGDYNVGLGFQALYDNTGNYNVGSGYGALYNNQGYSNVGSGYLAVCYNQGDYNVGIGYRAIGSGSYYSPGSYNVAMGYQALYDNRNGHDNVGVGAGALYDNYDNNYNTAVGSGALNNNVQNDNTAMGFRSLYTNSSGYANTAVGSAALFSNTVGYENTVTGSGALYTNTTGYGNTAIGYQALYSNTTGHDNVAVGKYALKDNTTGYYNVAVGEYAHQHNISGSCNTLIGGYTGQTLQTGRDNVYIGYGMNAAASNESSTTRIDNIYSSPVTGRNVYVTSSHKVGYLSSSRRFKENIDDMPATAVSDLNKLRPVTFNYKEEIDETKSKQFGLIAEEVLDVYPEAVSLGEDGEPDAVQYEQFIPILIEGHQQHDGEIETLKAQVAELTARLDALS